MKPPRYLIGAALVFWGWQAGFLIPGIVMAVILEGRHWIHARWDFSNEEFTRIWVFCTFLFLAGAIYAFTANEGPGGLLTFLQNPNFLTQRRAGYATARTAAALFRWLPMLFFLFIAAQAYSPRQGVPLETISLILRRRWNKARKAGQPIPAGRTVDVSWSYFGLCLFAAAVHRSDSSSFFWGLSGLLAWALWSYRSPRFGLATWLLCLGMATGLGYVGKRGVGNLQVYLGNLNPYWLGQLGRSRFDPAQSRSELGRLGRLKASNRIVIRVESSTEAPPPLLRETTYRTLKGLTWQSEFQETDFTTILEETNRGSWVLLRDKTNTLPVKIGCYLEGGKALLPLPSGVARMENLMAYSLSRSPLGAVLEQGPGLVLFDALYGSGATIDAPPDRSEDLAVPPREAPALDQVIEELDVDSRSLQNVLKALNTFFAEKFVYSTDEPFYTRSRTNATPLTRFLLKTHRGHCEYFATAGVLLLRQLGIPARYAVGYAVHESSGEGKFVVRQRDAHAWCLVWDEKRSAWRDVDFTPGTWVEAEAGRASWVQRLSDAWSRIRFELSRFRWGQSHLRDYLLWGVAPVLLLLLYQIVFRGRWRRAAASPRSCETIVWPGLDSEFYELESKLLTRRGLIRSPGETLSEWLGRAVQDPALAPLSVSLRRLLRMHYRYRFDPQGLDAAEREAFRQDVRSLLSQMDRLSASA